MTNLLSDQSAQASTSTAASSEGTRLGQITPEKRITFQPVPSVLPTDEEQAKNLRRGGLVALFLASLLALPYGLKYWLGALLIFLVTYNIGVMTGMLTESFAEKISRRRVARSGNVDYAGYSLTMPVDGEPYTFDLRSPHTLIRRFERTESGAITQLFIAQHEKQAILYSRERCDSETARDYGFTTDNGEALPAVPVPNRVEVPLRGLLELSRLVEAKRKQPEDARSGG